MPSKSSFDKIISEGYSELENQFILRLPERPSKALKEALQKGNLLKDRLSIKLENDMRKAEVQFDHYYMFGRIVDLPCIVESLKTVDNKSFYKTADISQMLICKEDEDPLPSDEEDKSKIRKKDPNKVDKKYIWPHGITPPMKNVRHRRFRKTLRKKQTDTPEIEKEVKRILRGDCEAINVRWEITCESDARQKSNDLTPKVEQPIKMEPQETSNSPLNMDVDEHEIFGEALSDSDDETVQKFKSGNMSIGVSKPLSFQDYSNGSDSISKFSDDMLVKEDVFGIKKEEPLKAEIFDIDAGYSDSSQYVNKADSSRYNYDQFKAEDDADYEYKESLRAKLDQLQFEMNALKARIHQQELEIINIENFALRQRFQDTLEELLSEQMEKQQQYQEISSLLYG